MEAAPLLSIIVAARNSAATIRACLETLERNLAAAGPGETEVIVVDGHSIDGTLDIVHSFSFPKTIVSSEVGAARAYNHGVRQARGRWIAFLNSDDEWTEGFLGAVLARLRGRNAERQAERLVLHTAVQFIDGRGRELYRRYPAPYIGFIQKHYSVILHPNACYPAALMKRHPFPILEGNRFSDREQVWALMREARAVRVPEAFYRYRISPHSGTVQLAREGAVGKSPVGVRLVALVGRLYVQWFETRLAARLVRLLLTGQTDWRAARVPPAG